MGILTEREKEALEITIRLMKALSELPVLHRDDISEHCLDVHNIQNRIMSRAYMREQQQADPDQMTKVPWQWTPYE